LNWIAVKSSMHFEMARFFRTHHAKLDLPPVAVHIADSWCLVAAIGSPYPRVEGITMGIYRARFDHAERHHAVDLERGPLGSIFPKFIGTVFELLSAPVNFIELLRICSGQRRPRRCCIGGSSDHSVFLCSIISHPFGWDLSVADLHQLFVDGFITVFGQANLNSAACPVADRGRLWFFLGGSFYSISMRRRCGR